MSLAGPNLARSSSSEPPTAAEPRPGRRSRRWLALLLIAALLVAIPVVILLSKAASYQPLTYGPTGVSTLAYPGLPAAQGARDVNTFGFVRQDVYIPPQRKGYTFYLLVDVANYGSRAVTIESVGLPADSALISAGPALYAAHAPGGYGAPGIPPARSVLHQVRLGPGGALLAAIPVRSWPCWTRYSAFVTVPSFNVTYRFLFFARTVALPWNPEGGELILHAPFGRPGQPDVVCIANS